MVNMKERRIMKCGDIGKRRIAFSYRSGGYPAWANVFVPKEDVTFDGCQPIAGEWYAVQNGVASPAPENEIPYDPVRAFAKSQKVA